LSSSVVLLSELISLVKLYGRGVATMSQTLI
jgi:hypothetical protein